MGQKRRAKPKRVTEKLIAVRQKLGMTHSQLATLLRFDKPSRIAEYERGARDIEIGVLLCYAKVSRLSLDTLANHNCELIFPKRWKRPRNPKALLRQDRINETDEQF